VLLNSLRQCVEDFVDVLRLKVALNFHLHIEVLLDAPVFGRVGCIVDNLVFLIGFVNLLLLFPRFDISYLFEPRLVQFFQRVIRSRRFLRSILIICLNGIDSSNVGHQRILGDGLRSILISLYLKNTCVLFLIWILDRTNLHARIEIDGEWLFDVGLHALAHFEALEGVLLGLVLLPPFLHVLGHG